MKISEQIGFFLMVVGGTLFLLGGVFYLFGHMTGRLPFDWVYRGERVTIWVPLGTSIFLSIVLTLLLNLILWIIGRR